MIPVPLSEMGSAVVCSCCGHLDKDLRIAPILFGDSFKEPRYAICPTCLLQWYDGPERQSNSWEELRAESLRLRAKAEGEGEGGEPDAE